MKAGFAETNEKIDQEGNYDKLAKYFKNNVK